MGDPLIDELINEEVLGLNNEWEIL